ncbi:MAG: TadE family type IV pilus minor pilin [Bowdeniella nasicola]|nr:TadE family type IV pilus minor pilin [Bowdeniella nasicola]
MTRALTPARVGRRDERGSATVETALVLPVIVMCLLLLLASGSLAATRIAVIEGARAGARALALGASSEEASEIARRVCDCSADVSITPGAWAQIRVRARHGLAEWVPGIEVDASYTLPYEPAP